MKLNKLFQKGVVYAFILFREAMASNRMEMRTGGSSRQPLNDITYERWNGARPGSHVPDEVTEMEAAFRRLDVQPQSGFRTPAPMRSDLKDERLMVSSWETPHPFLNSGSSYSICISPAFIMHYLLPFILLFWLYMFKTEPVDMHLDAFSTDWDHEEYDEAPARPQTRRAKRRINFVDKISCYISFISGFTKIFKILPSYP